MDFKKVTVTVAPGADREMLIAQLSHIGFDGFEELDNMLLAYVPEHLYDKPLLEHILTSEWRYEIADEKEQNWNAVWENNFPPVIIPDFCTVRASFHELAADTPYEIIITPKMSFGTGHHATTRLMLGAMKDMPLKGSTVLDFGTGTGILAIMAEKLGALRIDAIDTDEWAYDNAMENAARNRATRVHVHRGSLDVLPAGMRYNVILANINRHILLEQMQEMHDKLMQTGHGLLSGLLAEDENIITDAAQRAGFECGNTYAEGNWIAMTCRKALK